MAGYPMAAFLFRSGDEMHGWQPEQKQNKRHFMPNNYFLSVQGPRVREAARAVSMSEGADYIARLRVLARLREKIEKIDDK
ncbi:MAG: hypothetical protein R6U98_29570 [Pirellulaceae bacterium]